MALINPRTALQDWSGTSANLHLTPEHRLLKMIHENTMIDQINRHTHSYILEETWQECRSLPDDELKKVNKS